MAENPNVKIQSVEELQESAANGCKGAMKELARRLMKGLGEEKNVGKGVALLEECTALDDAEAMVMLAKCCAIGRGMERDTGRAKTLLSHAAKKGNNKAQIVMRFFDEWKEKPLMTFSCLFNFPL